MDSGATAVVVSTREARGVEVVVTGSVPHHLDGSWPPPPARLDVPGTCLLGGPEADLLSAPSVRDLVERFTQRQVEEEGALAAVNADPWLQDIGLPGLLDDLGDWELTWASCGRD
ncbi:MAG: hypothetical protein ACXWDL_12475, partial [Nocardioides sp.]